MISGYSETYFLAWQASVEGTFIQRRAAQEGKSVALEDYKVWMQKFPYPAHKKVYKDYSAIAFIPWVVCYGYLVFILNLVRRVIEEKANGSKVSKVCKVKEFWFTLALRFDIRHDDTKFL
ncbi:hypothetical protein AVEN_116650-1 [Araneus ventricosus]|uniref:Uncharacterized protein n=1 Tax=Araneus ventricosus TaxID=182803 RepID=A0A4Y2BVK1_ARAVE|nr:hypothetical protein AVEN_143132-1 [Araneus ventricosus]GBL95579.1 hypothetical protein AVEN_116650-1 [Araneus ventricosus]